MWDLQTGSSLTKVRCLSHKQSTVCAVSNPMSGLEAARTFFTSLLKLFPEVQVRTGVLVLGIIFLFLFPVGPTYVFVRPGPFFFLIYYPCVQVRTGIFY